MFRFDRGMGGERESWKHWRRSEKGTRPLGAKERQRSAGSVVPPSLVPVLDFFPTFGWQHRPPWYRSAGGSRSLAGGGFQRVRTLFWWRWAGTGQLGGLPWLPAFHFGFHLTLPVVGVTNAQTTVGI